MLSSVANPPDKISNGLTYERSIIPHVFDVDVEVFDDVDTYDNISH